MIGSVFEILLARSSKLSASFWAEPEYSYSFKASLFLMEFDFDHVNCSQIDLDLLKGLSRTFYIKQVILETQNPFITLASHYDDFDGS